MKLIRTARSHERLTFGPDADSDLAEVPEEDHVVVDRTGVVVSEADAKRYEARAEELGIAVILEDAEKGDEPPPAAPAPGLVATGRPSHVASTGAGDTSTDRD